MNKEGLFLQVVNVQFNNVCMTTSLSSLKKWRQMSWYDLIKNDRCVTHTSLAGRPVFPDHPTDRYTRILISLVSSTFCWERKYLVCIQGLWVMCGNIISINLARYTSLLALLISSLYVYTGRYISTLYVYRYTGTGCGSPSQTSLL